MGRRRCRDMHRAPPNLQITVIGIAVLLTVGGAFWASRPPTPTEPVQVVPTPSGVEATLTIHVTGAVLRPGVVHVPEGSRVVDAVAAAGGATADADFSTLNLAALASDAAHVHVPAVGESSAGGGAEGIDLNAASASDLEALPGVGPVLAARIVAYRVDHGPFVTIEDLLDVPGIGEAKLAQMRDVIARP